MQFEKTTRKRDKTHDSAYKSLLTSAGITEETLATALGYADFHSMRTSSRYRRGEIQKTVLAITNLFALADTLNNVVPAGGEADYTVPIPRPVLQNARDTLLLNTLIDKSSQSINAVRQLDDLFPFLNEPRK